MLYTLSVQTGWLLLESAEEEEEKIQAARSRQDLQFLTLRKLANIGSVCCLPVFWTRPWSSPWASSCTLLIGMCRAVFINCLRWCFDMERNYCSARQFLSWSSPHFVQNTTSELSGACVVSAKCSLGKPKHTAVVVISWVIWFCVLNVCGCENTLTEVQCCRVMIGLKDHDDTNCLLLYIEQDVCDEYFCWNVWTVCSSFKHCFLHSSHLQNKVLPATQ